MRRSHVVLALGAVVLSGCGMAVGQQTTAFRFVTYHWTDPSSGVEWVLYKFMAFVAVIIFMVIVAVIALGWERLASPRDPKLKRDLVRLIKGFGCVLAIGLVILAISVIWASTFDCFLADNFDYVTKQCALKLLQKPDCNVGQDILDVDEISDTSYKDDKGNRVEARSVIYQFKKRPFNGPVSADVLRDIQILHKNAQGHWKVSCER